VPEYRDIDLIVEEWISPKEGRKEIFFRNLFSTAGEPQYKSSITGSVYNMLTILRVMWGLDNYLVLVDFGGWKGGWRVVVESAFTCAVMGTLVLLGKTLGLKAVNEEYTPQHLMKTWEEDEKHTIRKVKQSALAAAGTR